MNPEIVAPFVKPEIVPPNRRFACSGSILLWVDLVFDSLALFDFLVVVVVAWVVLVLLFSNFGLISDLMIFFFLLGIENLGFVRFDDIFVWKLRKCEKM